MKKDLFGIIQRSLWGAGEGQASRAVYEEMVRQAIAALPAAILSSFSLPKDMLEEWKKAIYQQITYNTNYCHVQAKLPISVPYVILKGSSASKYYPYPLYRTMGDIDIMTKREEHASACDELTANGYTETTNAIDRAVGRHRQFLRDDVVVEVHISYAHQNDPAKAKLLDDLIIANINPTHELPDLVNGIVLIEHVNHHMENGLGLRQIIDWMMFVDKCLPDEKWPEFQKLARGIGREKLAIVVTRMCEKYLGLPERMWSRGADPAVCEQLMNYILASGNFGIKQDESSRVSRRFLSSTRTVKGAFRFLQGRGLVTWKAAQTHPGLRPFAWLYQASRYIKKGLQRKDAFTKLLQEYKTKEARNALFDALDISREEKGIVKFRDGRYN